MRPEHKGALINVIANIWMEQKQLLSGFTTADHSILRIDLAFVLRRRPLPDTTLPSILVWDQNDEIQSGRWLQL